MWYMIDDDLREQAVAVISLLTDYLNIVNVTLTLTDHVKGCFILAYHSIVSHKVSHTLTNSQFLLSCAVIPDITNKNTIL